MLKKHFCVKSFRVKENLWYITYNLIRGQLWCAFRITQMLRENHLRWKAFELKVNRRNCVFASMIVNKFEWYSKASGSKRECLCFVLHHIADICIVPCRKPIPLSMCCCDVKLLLSQITRKIVDIVLTRVFEKCVKFLQLQYFFK